jgi:hypothetical protein
MVQQALIQLSVEGFDMTFERASTLHEKLVGINPLHASPCEQK